MSACPMCRGTDTQRECEQGQCYAEEYQRQEQEREQREWQRRIDEEREA